MSGNSQRYNLGVYAPVTPLQGSLVPVAFGSSAFPRDPSPWTLNATPIASDSSKFLGVSSGRNLLADVNAPRVSSFADFLQSSEPDANKSLGNLFVDVVDLTPLSRIKTAAEAGQTLYDSTKAIEQSQMSQLEAVTCQTAKVVAETAIGTAATGIVVGGVPLLIAESLAFPPLAVTIPVAGVALPQAYSNAQELGVFAGKKAKADCHLLFSNSKK